MALHKRGDCYISLNRGEGWGLGIFDAAGYSKPVIVTGFGAPIEFLPKDYELFVDYTEVPIKKPFQLYDTSQKWAEPSIIDAIKKIKTVFNNKEKYSTIGKKLSNHIRTNYNAEVVSKIMKAGL